MNTNLIKYYIQRIGRSFLELAATDEVHNQKEYIEYCRNKNNF